MKSFGTYSEAKKAAENLVRDLGSGASALSARLTRTPPPRSAEINFAIRSSMLRSIQPAVASHLVVEAGSLSRSVHFVLDALQVSFVLQEHA